MQTRIYIVQIKEGHRLYPCLAAMCERAKNLSNSTNFHIRQVVTPWPVQSKRLERLSRKRTNKLLDLFHKASFHLVKIAVEERIGTIVIGRSCRLRFPSASADLPTSSLRRQDKWGSVHFDE